MIIKNIIERFLEDELFDRLSHTVRWNGMNRIKDETVGTHSYLVTLYSRFLAEEIFKDDKNKLSITTYAILHDFDEIFTGDVLHYVKYNEINGEIIRDALDYLIEFQIREKFSGSKNSDYLMCKTLLKEFPTYISKIVKVADWLSMYFYLKKEKELGNKAVLKQLDYCVQKLKLACQDAINDMSSKLQPEQFDFEILWQLKQKTYEQ